MSQENVEIVRQAFDAFADGRMNDVMSSMRTWICPGQ
jgi:hypothetical protein